MFHVYERESKRVKAFLVNSLFHELGYVVKYQHVSHC